MMVVGLYSGKEILVQDKSYFVTIGNTDKQVFISPDGKRRLTVELSRIEFYDEVHSDKYMELLHKSIIATAERKSEQVKNKGVDYQ